MTPAISAIVVAPFGFEDVRQLVRMLAGQTIRDRLELVLVRSAAGGVDDAEPALAAFAACRIIEHGTMAALTEARAAGIRAASAPIVVLTEDHCFPDPGWAEALLRAHEGPWAAVGPVFEQPIQSETLARSSCLLQYAAWTHPARTGEVDDLPGHNSSYKRAVLLEYGDRLGAMLTAESVLHWDLQRRGHRLWLEDGARVYHAYMSTAAASFRETFYIGRGFAATRARTWSAGRRAAFAAAIPLVPAVRLRRIVARAFEFGWGAALPSILAGVVPQLAMSTAGELMGTLLGPGRAVAMGVELDTRRYRFVSREARALFWGENGRVPALEARLTAGPLPAGEWPAAAPAPRS